MDGFLSECKPGWQKQPRHGVSYRIQPVAL
jgi:hypothetical protein